MDYKSLISRMLTVCFLCYGIGESLFAQTAKPKPRDTPSHRHLPLMDGLKTPKPKPQDFLTPELKELHRQLSTLKREQRIKQRRPRPIRRPGESSRDRVQRERMLQEQLSKQIPVARSNEIEEQIRSTSEELGRRLGGALAESLKSGSIPFDPNNKTSFWDQASELADTVRKKQQEVDRQYKQAMEQYKKAWPLDSVAPEEWMNKVQPFINSEVIEQLSEARKQFEAQKHLPPEQRDFTGLFPNGSPLSETEKSSGMIDSLMSSLDKQSVEWLKSATKDKKNGSFWKSLTRGAKNSITQINRKMTDNSRNQVAKTPSIDQRRQQSSSPLFSPNRSNTNGPTGSSASKTGAAAKATPGAPTSTGFPWWGLLALLAIIAPIAFYLRKQIADVSVATSSGVIRADSIHDRESLLAACHQLAIRTFGLRSCFWNHRTLFQKLMDRIDGRNQIIEQLSQIYERARYAPEQRLTQNDVDRARNLFTQIRGVARARQ